MQVERNYPVRYPPDIFDKCKEMYYDENLMRKYKIWKSGRSYITNKKMDINCYPHKKLGELFLLSFTYNLTPTTLATSTIDFMKLYKTHKETYLKHTKRILDGIDEENESIRQYNAKYKDKLISQQLTANIII